MEPSIILTLAVLLVLILLVGVCSAAQTALQRLNRVRLRHLAAEGIPQARELSEVLEADPSLESTVVAANAGALVLGGVMWMGLVGRWLGDDASVSYLVVSLGVLALLWVQLVARALGAARPESVLRFLLRPLQVLHLLLHPMTWALRGLTQVVVPKEREVSLGGVVAAEDEFRGLVGAAEGESPLQQEERMIHSIFEMGETTAREIMVPRVDMVAVEAAEPLRVVLDRIKSRGHSRIPIYDGTIDNVVGTVYAKDLLSHMESGSLEDPALTLARPPHFVPESKKIDELLHEMQRTKVHMAVVLDEFGGTSGLVTIEDLLEEIVGEIQDEYDTEEKSIERLAEDEAIFDSRVSIHDVQETLGVTVANGDYDTVGGLVYDRLGKIPLVGDTVEMDGLALTVLSTVGKRIRKVSIRVSSGATESDGNGRD